jgi:hypothetical protein
MRAGAVCVCVCVSTLSLVGNGSVKIPLSLLDKGLIKIPLSLLGNGSVETFATIEELLEASFSMWPVLYQGKWAISSSHNFLFEVYKQSGTRINLE